MFKSILKSKNQNRINITLVLSLMFSFYYILTPALSHAAINCTTAPRNDKSYGPYDFISNKNAGMEYHMSDLSLNFNCNFAIKEIEKNNALNNISGDVDTYLIIKLTNEDNTPVVNGVVYDSGIPGMDMKTMTNGHGNNCTLTSTNIEMKCRINTNEKNVNLSFKYYLVKRNNTTNTNSSLEFHRGKAFKVSYYLESEGVSSAHETSFGNTHIMLQTYTCSFNTTNLNFNFGKQQNKDYTSIGPKGNEQIDYLHVQCNNADGIKLSLKVEGTPEPGYMGVIKLSPEQGAATGVGVQLLIGQNKDPIEIGKTKEIGVSSYDPLSRIYTDYFTITARYYQTENTVTPGTANASATFTMTYQ